MKGAASSEMNQASRFASVSELVCKEYVPTVSTDSYRFLIEVVGKAAV